MSSRISRAAFNLSNATEAERRETVRLALEQARSILGAAKRLGVSEKMVRLMCQKDPSLFAGIEPRKPGRTPKYA